MTYILIVLLTSTIVIMISRLRSNALYVFKGLYIIRRDNGKSSDKRLSKAFMRGLSYPWYTGRGIQLRIKSNVIQIGTCKAHPDQQEEEGALSVVGGRYMDSTAKDIREWQ